MSSPDVSGRLQEGLCPPRLIEGRPRGRGRGLWRSVSCEPHAQPTARADRPRGLPRHHRVQERRGHRRCSPTLPAVGRLGCVRTASRVDEGVGRCRRWFHPTGGSGTHFRVTCRMQGLSQSLPSELPGPLRRYGPAQHRPAPASQRRSHPRHSGRCQGIPCHPQGILRLFWGISRHRWVTLRLHQGMGSPLGARLAWLALARLGQAQRFRRCWVAFCPRVSLSLRRLTWRRCRTSLCQGRPHPPHRDPKKAPRTPLRC